MKKLLQNKYAAFLFFGALFALTNGCTDNEENPYYSDAYLINLDVYVSHSNPVTGADYTDAELEQLSYDPLTEESYLEGQNVDLSVTTTSRPSEIQVLAEDGSVLETITEFSDSQNGFLAKAFSRSLEDLGLMEVGDKIKLDFKITYPEGPPVSENFTVKRTGVVEGPVSYFAFFKKSGGETFGLATVEDVISKEDDPDRGTVVTFNGVDNNAMIKDTVDLSFKDTGDFSIGIWINTVSTEDDPSIISDKDWGSGGNPGFVLAFTGGTWKLNAADGNNRIDINDLGPINDGAWHFLTVTFDRDGNATAYQDGIEVGSADMSVLGDMASGLPIYLGQDGTGNYGYWFEGKLANSTIFDYILTPDQIGALYNQ